MGAGKSVRGGNKPGGDSGESHGKTIMRSLAGRWFQGGAPGKKGFQEVKVCKDSQCQKGGKSSTTAGSDPWEPKGGGEKPW